MYSGAVVGTGRGSLMGTDNLDEDGPGLDGPAFVGLGAFARILLELG